MRVLITGITGFLGTYLAEQLLSEGQHVVAGLSRQGKWHSSHQKLGDRVELYAVDLSDAEALDQLLMTFQPDWIFHLAGYANTGTSFHEPRQCWKDNLDATHNLYYALQRLGLNPRLLFTSTGLIYGDPDRPGEPCDENTVLKPASPYAASKAATDLLSYQYFRTIGLPVVRLRLYNQFGPRQSPDYALPSFARQIALAEAGRQEPCIRTGDLSSYRDLTDVRDMVRAMRLVIELGQPGEAYNAGSGQAHQMRGLLAELVKLSRVPVTVEERTDPLRRTDTSISRADIRKLNQGTGWQPQLSITQSLSDLLDYWRVRIQHEPSTI